jgi:hypothetical protein
MKVRPDLLVFLRPNPFDVSKIISAIEWARGDDPRSHHRSDSRKLIEF